MRGGAWRRDGCGAAQRREIERKRELGEGESHAHLLVVPAAEVLLEAARAHVDPRATAASSIGRVAPQRPMRRTIGSPRSPLPRAPDAVLVRQHAEPPHARPLHHGEEHVHGALQAAVALPRAAAGATNVQRRQRARLGLDAVGPARHGALARLLAVAPSGADAGQAAGNLRTWAGMRGVVSACAGVCGPAGGAPGQAGGAPCAPSGAASSPCSYSTTCRLRRVPLSQNKSGLVLGAWRKLWEGMVSVGATRPKTTVARNTA